MAVWLIRAGAQGEHEQKFLRENRAYVTWEGLDIDLRSLDNRDMLLNALRERYPDEKERTIINWSGQIWPFVNDIKTGDWIVIPLKSQRAVQIGVVRGDYIFEANGPDPYYHWRQIEWIGEAIPRNHFGDDLLNTFGAFLTICRVQSNNAEERLQAMKRNGWQPETVHAIVNAGLTPIGIEADSETDIEERAADGIAKLILSRFKGHNLTRLVEAILKAEGYTTWRSTEGTDGGVDILAGAGPLGFGAPRLCVEVKSGDKKIDRPTVDKLIGAISKFGAAEGLFVSWSGFKQNVDKELAPMFFKIRLWTQKELLDALFAVYDKLDEDIKAELPLKRVWTVAVQDE